MAKTTKTKVSNPQPLTKKPFPGEKHPMINPDIPFYKVEGGDKSDSGDESVTHIKIDKY